MIQIDANALEEELQEELEQFRREKEQIRAILGQVGGVGSAKRDLVVNVAFITALVVFFVLDVLRHVLGLDVPLPAMFSIELGVLMVSTKIVWMIYKQTKVEHFQFWILSSIEFRLNDVAKRVRAVESAVVGAENPDAGAPD